MENKFIDKQMTWADGKGIIIRHHASFFINEKPKFSFEYDALYAESTHLAPWRYSKTERIPLTEEECTEVLDFITNHTPEVYVLAIDEHGHYLGRLKEGDPAIKGTVIYGPPNGDPWWWDGIDQEWKLSSGVNGDGDWIGIQRKDNLAAETPPPPVDRTINSPRWKWDFELGEWYDGRQLETVKVEALDEIARLATATLRQAIPDIPGIIEIFRFKYEEAVDYLGEKKMPDHRFLKLELILDDTKTLDEIATEIIAAAHKHQDMLFHIEEARRTTLKSIADAKEIADVESALQLFDRFYANAKDRTS